MKQPISSTQNRVFAFFSDSLSKGFTMIEMLVVITIIAVITGIGMVSYTNSSRSARNARRQSDLEVVRSALVLYYSDNGCYPAGNYEAAMLTIQDYLQKAPNDPKTPTFDYTYVPGGAPCGSDQVSAFTLNATREPLTEPTIAVNNP